LDTAERRLEETGTVGLSLRELAREVGVSHGAPRQHFPDKQALLDALAVRGLNRLGTSLSTALAAADGGLEERLVCFAGAYVKFATTAPALLALMFARKDRPDAPELAEANDRAFAAPVALISDAQAAGEIDSEDPDRVAMALLATLQGLATLVTARMVGDRPLDAVVSGTIRTLLDGLRPRERSSIRDAVIGPRIDPPRL
jgi:AcrR family transcriptional regulator